MQQTTIVLLTGFLGAGKTTVLNHLLENMPGTAADGQDLPKIGVIVNEFGQVSIDAPVLTQNGYQVTELNNGSIFCQCLSGTFIETMARLLQYDLDYLLIESTGLADPANMGVIMAQLKQKTDRPYRFAGTICLVDAKYFRKLRQSLDTVNRQVLAASLIVINKADLVDADTLEDVTTSVRKLNPMAHVITTIQGRIDPLCLHTLRKSRLSRHLPSLNTPAGRPNTVLLLTDEVIERTRLTQFIERLSDQVYRIKGLVQLADGFYRLDVIGQETTLSPLQLSGGRSEIIVIPQPGIRLQEVVADLAERVLAVKAEID